MKMKEEKRKITKAEFEAYRQYRAECVHEKLQDVQEQCSTNWMSLNKEERDEAIENVFRDGNRTRWDQSMLDLERANSKRTTRVLTGSSIRTGYPKWEQGRQQ